MSNHAFMFLNDAFPVISEGCKRLEKNIIEGDGIDGVLWAGKVAEKITREIGAVIGLDLQGLNQYEILRELEKFSVIPDEILKKFHYIRVLRNRAIHENIEGEIYTAKKTHFILFQIACWFYGNYMSDKKYLNLQYPGILYKHDTKFIKKIADNRYEDVNINYDEIKSIINKSVDENDLDINEVDNYEFNSDLERFLDNDSVFFNEELRRWTACVTKHGKVITVGHFKTRRDAIRKGSKYIESDDFKNYEYTLIPNKRKDGKYSASKDITFDEELEMWTAFFNKKSLGYFISESAAKVVRKEYIDTLPIPEKKNGKYSDYEGISFDKNHKLWFIRLNGKVRGYYDTEGEAIQAREKLINNDNDAKKLGIVKEGDNWISTFKQEYIGEFSNEKDAIEARHNYIKKTHLPQKNIDGNYSIHKGIDFDEENYVWVLKLKDQVLGYFDTEEDAFYYKKEFLADKGIDVSELDFESSEELDFDDDFKVEINSDEKGAIYDKFKSKWIAKFRGREIGEFDSEEDARRYRLQYLKTLPYPPRKPNKKYSYYEGIDYNINRHLWSAAIDEYIIGFFDSEEDAFYARKEALVKKGEDVNNIHFIKGNKKKNISFSEASESLSQKDEEIEEINEEDIINKVPSINKNKPIIGFKSLFNKFKEDKSIGENLKESSDYAFREEVKFSFYDSNNNKKIVLLNYKKSEVFIELKGTIHKNQLNVSFLDYVDNLSKVNYSKSSLDDYFNVSIKLEYNLEDLKDGKFFKIISDLGWEYNLLNILSGNSSFSNKTYSLDDTSYESSNLDDNDYNLNKPSSIVKNNSIKNYNISKETEDESELVEDDKDIVSKDIPIGDIEKPKAIIRNGRRVTKEEAEALDNAVEAPTIKSRIISEKPKDEKDFKVYSLEDIATLTEDYEDEEEVDFDEFIDSDEIVDLDEFDENILSEDEESDDIVDIFNEVDKDSTEFMENESLNSQVDDDLEELVSDEIVSEDNNLESNYTVRNGKLVTKEEAEALDNAVEAPIIKSNIISEKPKVKKDFKTQTLGDIISIDGYDEDKDNSVNKVTVTSETEDLSYNESIESDVKSESKPNYPADAFDDKYSDSLEVYYDEDKEKWLAVIDGAPLKLFNTPKEAYMARKKRLRRIVNKPRRMLNGKYSNYDGIDFDFKELMWSISVNNIVVGYSINEKKAIASRKFFIEKILEPSNIEIEDFNEEIYNELCDKDFNLNKLIEDES